MTDLVPANAGRAPLSRFEELWRVAGHISATALVPDQLRGKREEVFAILLYGDALGLNPMIALSQMYVVSGKVSMKAELLEARVREAGGRLDVLERNEKSCTMKGTRRDGTTLTVTFTMADAERAGLVKRNPNYVANPRQMLHARARTELARALFPEATLGLAYTPDELGDDREIPEYVDAETGEILEAEVVEDENPDRDWRAAAAKARGDRTQQTGDTP